MNKTQLVEAVAESAELTKAAATRAVDAFLNTVTTTLASGEQVVCVGFGTFDVKTRAARKGRNPQTGAEIEIKEAILPVFKAGKVLKDAVANAKVGEAEGV